MQMTNNNKETNDQNVDCVPKSHEFSYCGELDSWLNFNARVINEAKRSINPILERFNFIGIAESNLNEFIRTKFSLNKGMKKKITEQTKVIESTFDSLKEELLTKYGLSFVTMNDIRDDKKAYYGLKEEFKKNIFPLIQPLILKNELPLPRLDDGGTFIITRLADSVNEVTGIIRLPEISLLKVKGSGSKKYITNEEVIMEFIGNFYRGKTILWNKMFRVYRRIDSLSIDINDNYIDGIRSQLYNRSSAEIVMVDIDSDIEGIESITGDARKRKRHYVGGLTYLSSVKDIIDRDDNMVFSKAKPRKPIAFSKSESMFDTLTKGDVLVHFPYESFEKSTIRFLEEAARDPNVVSIKQTLYRVSKNSRLTKALIEAAKSGKQVVVLLELKAKMDEYNNLKIADQLKEAGCHIIFGDTSMKTHAKTTLIIRKEGSKLAKYVNVSTGNFNEKTAKIYEDISYFAKDRKKFRCGDDLLELFTHLGGFSDVKVNNELLISPINFRSKIIEEIDNCIKHSKESSIVMKMNSLTDHRIAEKLYEASNAGVKIKLIVRGMCILIPGVNGQSENIEVISIVGRYLEHSRIYEFKYNNQHNVYIGSGDMMPRNLDYRIEVVAPIINPSLKLHLSELLKQYFKDNMNSYKLNSEGTYICPSDSLNLKSFSVQNELIKHYKKVEKSIIK